MKFHLPRIAVGAAAVLMSAVAAPAMADTISVKAGPIMLPGVPLEVCANDNCATTPSLNTLTLKVDLSADGLSLLLPTVVPVPCPSGQLGLAFAVTANTTNSSVAATVSGDTADAAGNAMTFSKTVGIKQLPINHTVTISACST